MRRRDFIKISAVTGPALLLGIQGKKGSSNLEYSAAYQIDQHGKIRLISVSPIKPR